MLAILTHTHTQWCTNTYELMKMMTIMPFGGQILSSVPSKYHRNNTSNERVLHKGNNKKKCTKFHPTNALLHVLLIAAVCSCLVWLFFDCPCVLPVPFDVSFFGRFTIAANDFGGLFQSGVTFEWNAIAVRIVLEQLHDWRGNSCNDTTMGWDVVVRQKKSFRNICADGDTN